jgi:low affinity Fe/Cu permease
MSDQESWHLSKSVPITFIMAVAVQTFLLVAYISNMNASMEVNTRDIARHEIRIATLERTTQQQAITLGRIDENIKAIRDMVDAMSNNRSEQ